MLTARDEEIRAIKQRVMKESRPREARDRLEDGKTGREVSSLYRTMRTAPTVARHELKQCLARIVDGELSVGEKSFDEEAPE